MAVSGHNHSNSWLTAALLAPTTLWFVFLLIMPLIVIIIFSFGERAAVGGYGGGFTFEQYANLPARLKAFQNTLTYAPLGTLLALLVACTPTEPLDLPEDDAGEVQESVE